MNKYLNKNPLTSIGLTFDLDWAPDFIIEDIINLLQNYQVKATFFCTHQSKILKRVDREMIELGIHPNFRKKNVVFDKEIKKLKNLFPEAKGVRSHYLIQSTPILDLFVKHNLKYDCNLLLWQHENLRPFKNWNKLIRVPYFWEDDLHLVSGDELRLDKIPLKTKGSKVFALHPVHIFLNTSNLAIYKKYKMVNITNKQGAKKYISKGNGVRTFFIELLELIKNQKIKTYKLAEIIPERGK